MSIRRDFVPITCSENPAMCRAILDTAAAAIVTITPSGIVRSFNRAAEALFDYQCSEVVGGNISLLMPEPDRSAHDNYLARYLSKGGRAVIGKGREVEGRRKNGSRFFCHLAVSELIIEGEHLFAGVIVDLTQQKHVEAELRTLSAAFATQEAVMVTDAGGNILRVNTAFENLTGYHADEIIGRNPRLLKSGRHDEQFYKSMWRHVLDSGCWHGEMWDRRKDGSLYPKECSITAIKNAQGEISNYVAVFMDISARKQAEKEIHDLEFFDTLTKLPNRRLLLDRLGVAVLVSARNRFYGALFVLDLDNFKALNDTKGHSFGDALLIEVASRIRSCVREVDTVSRLGGDEFAVLIENIGMDEASGARHIMHIAEKVRDALSADYQVQADVAHLSASIGVYLFSGSNESAEDLIKRSEVAMYNAKDEGRNTIRFFTVKLQQDLEKRTALETDLRHAIASQQFRLYYQVQMNHELRPLGAEALIRWEHPLRGLVSPAEFIPIAEESGLILDIGAWVLDTACRQLKAWEVGDETRHLVLAINVSAHQFKQPEFFEQVKSAIETHRINPARLKLELTESAALDDLAVVVSKMQSLKDGLGIGLSLDDFGTGYSSLSYLKRLPLDQVKIDRSFVLDMAIDTSDAVMVKAIVDIANNFKLEVIAEGVETEDQLALLKEIGCQRYQGYLFSRPVPIEQFAGVALEECYPANTE
jgi:diguanylate cyclase (GGDEF)-like protein/PAS domain S-box-containing protein